jgi:hypothetical protein
MPSEQEHAAERLAETPAGDENGTHVHPDVRYERKDVRYRPLVWAGVILIGFFLILAPLCMWGLFQVLGGRYGRKSEPITREPPRTTINQELDDLRRREEELLTSFAWVSREQQVVRIPLQRAMSLVAARHAEENHE